MLFRSCSGVVGDCTVTMNAAKSVTATFEAPQVLSVTVSGRGTGGVSGGGIDCPASVCSLTIKYGTPVQLVADWGAGSVFGGWSGSCAGTSSVCDVTMTAPVSLIATFNPPSAIATLSKSAANGGTGTVTSALGATTGINCGPTCTSGSFTYLIGDTIVFTATPATDSYFLGWGGDCASAGIAATCTLTLQSNVTVTAGFGRPALSVSKDGSGGGKVTGDAGPKINCGATCTQIYAPGTVVTLTATASRGSVFAGWTGPCRAYPTSTQCEVLMDVAKAVTATFATATANLSVSVSGSGSVSSSPSGITACTTTCSGTFASGATVTLTATPTGGASFLGWTAGPCSGSLDPVCSFTISGATVAIATFSA